MQRISHRAEPTIPIWHGAFANSLCFPRCASCSRLGSNSSPHSTHTTRGSCAHRKAIDIRVVDNDSTRNYTRTDASTATSAQNVTHTSKQDVVSRAFDLLCTTAETQSETDALVPGSTWHSRRYARRRASSDTPPPTTTFKHYLTVTAVQAAARVLKRMPGLGTMRAALALEKLGDVLRELGSAEREASSSLLIVCLRRFPSYSRLFGDHMVSLVHVPSFRYI